MDMGLNYCIFWAPHCLSLVGTDRVPLTFTSDRVVMLNSSRK